MLFEFRVQNYLSFCQEATFSMLAANSVKEHNGSDDPADSNLLTFASGRESILKFAAIYGANSSGKSNLIRSIADMRYAVLESNLNDECLLRLSNNAFKLTVDSQTKASAFEISFSIEETLYRYGFEFFNGVVTSEWLFRRQAQASRESYCFRRENSDIKVNSRSWKGAGGIDAKTRANALFLSTCAQFNVEEAIQIKDWFRNKLVILSGVDNSAVGFTVSKFHNDPEWRAQILGFMHQIDAGIRNISVKFRDLPQSPSEPNTVKKHFIDIFMERDLYRDGEAVGTVKLPFAYESEGTKKAFAFSGPWFEVLKNDGVLIVDEFGASLHTALSIELVKVFQKSTTSRAQLITATHDTNLLRKDLLRRDQIWFTEKNFYGATDLYSLVEYRIDQARAVRNNASYGKDYLLGRYGAIPYFGDVAQFLGSFGSVHEE